MKFKKEVWIKAAGACERCGESNEKTLTVHHHDKDNYPYNKNKAELLCLNCHWGLEHNFANRWSD